MNELDSTIGKGLVQEWTQCCVASRDSNMSGQIINYTSSERTDVWKLNLKIT